MDRPARLSDTPPAAAPPAAPEGMRLYAVGDVHGCRAHLRILLGRIAADAAGTAQAAIRIVFLGDYVDRGPDSAGVIDDILMLGREGLAPHGLDDGRPVTLVTLKGNHEDYFARFLLGDLTIAPSWMINGGAETLESYDVEPPARHDDPDDLLRASRDLSHAVPTAHRRFLDALAHSHRAGGYFLVHAGVRPGVPLDAQDPAELIWIRKPFLESDADFGAFVVHGHTPVPTVEERPNRLDIDTGACYGGELTAACFWGTERRFLRAAI